MVGALVGGFVAGSDGEQRADEDRGVNEKRRGVAPRPRAGAAGVAAAAADVDGPVNVAAPRANDANVDEGVVDVATSGPRAPDDERGARPRGWANTGGRSVRDGTQLIELLPGDEKSR